MGVSLAAELYAALCAAILGLLLSLLWDAFSVLRILLGLFYEPHLPARLLSFPFPFLSSPLLPNQAQKPIRARSAALFLLDFVYALTSGIAFILFVYAFHDGVFRLFLLLAAVLSFVLYRLTLGRVVFFALGTVAFLLRVLLSYLALAVRLPLAIIARTLLFGARVLAGLLLRFFLCILAPIATSRSLSSAKRGSERFLFACVK